MSERRNWWSDGIRKGWLGRYESELVYFLREKTGRLTNDEQLVLVFLSLFLKSGHTTLPLGLSPKKWGEVVGVPPESIVLLPGKKIPPGDLLKNEKLARSEEHTSELQSRGPIVCRLLLLKRHYTNSTSNK